MSTPVRIAGFVAVLAAVFGVAVAAGAALDPDVDEPAAEHDEESQMKEHAETQGGATHASGALPGLAVAQDGYRLIPQDTELASGSSVAYRFRIEGSDGETVRDFDVEHERRMHLIVVRRDLAGFQHLHPRQLGDGSWEAEADLEAGGVYRVFADFATAGRSLTLATDLFVPGAFEPDPLEPPRTVADAGAGYEVAIDAGKPKAGGVTETVFSVTRDGEELDGVEPYLGADGHLVALREHDLAFLHTHPEGEPGGPGPITFGVEYPTSGRYRLFLQFKHEGEVRTAAFTQVVRGGAAAPDAGHAEEDGNDGGH